MEKKTANERETVIMKCFIKIKGLYFWLASMVRARNLLKRHQRY